MAGLFSSSARMSDLRAEHVPDLQEARYHCAKADCHIITEFVIRKYLVDGAGNLLFKTDQIIRHRLKLTVRTGVARKLAGMEIGYLFPVHAHIVGRHYIQRIRIRCFSVGADD